MDLVPFPPDIAPLLGGENVLESGGSPDRAVLYARSLHEDYPEGVCSFVVPTRGIRANPILRFSTRKVELETVEKYPRAGGRETLESCAFPDGKILVCSPPYTFTQTLAVAASLMEAFSVAESLEERAQGLEGVGEAVPPEKVRSLIRDICKFLDRKAAELDRTMPRGQDKPGPMSDGTNIINPEGRSEIEDWNQMYVQFERDFYESYRDPTEEEMRVMNACVAASLKNYATSPEALPAVAP